MENDIDIESLKGRFGWEIICNFHIPYLFRPDGKYCALRILDCVVFKNIPLPIRNELLSCTTSQNVSATEVELKLLHVINSNHCNFQYGTRRFGSNDLLLNISQAVEVCKFMLSCYNLLQKNRDNDFSSRCGFIKVDKVSLVPYCVKNNEKYVPAFYFEGDINGLKKSIIKMEGLELSYLKFCCKIQGINNGIFDSKSCSVLSLEVLKEHLDKNTAVEEFWPLRSTQCLNKFATLSNIFHLDKNLFNKNQNDIKNREIENPQNTLSIATKGNLTNVSKQSSQKRNAFYVGPYNKSPFYSIQKINIENRLINCIIDNSDINDKWVTLEDLCRELFFNTPVIFCQKVLNNLNIYVRKANPLQNLVLQNTGLYKKNCILTLVQVEQVQQNLLPIKNGLENYKHLLLQ